MKRDRDKGPRPEYEDLVYDETPSVVVYYPTRGGDEDAPGLTVKRDRSTAFVPDLSELEPLTREQPAVAPEETSVTPLFQGRPEPVIDPAKPVPPNLQSRGVLAWDPTHRDPADDEAFRAFFRPERAPAPQVDVPAQTAETAVESTVEWREDFSDQAWASDEGASDAVAEFLVADADVPVPSGPDSVESMSHEPTPIEQTPVEETPLEVTTSEQVANDYRPVVFETDIIAADFIEADAIRADPPTMRPVTPPDEPQAEDSAAPVERVPAAITEAAPAFPAEDEAPAWSSSEPSYAADYTSIDLDLDGPDTQMRFLQEWEAEVTGAHGAQPPSGTGRLFRALRAQSVPESIPALRRDQAARLRTLGTLEEAPEATAAAATTFASDEPARPVDVGWVAPQPTPEEERLWTANSMAGLAPIMVYLITLASTLIAGFVNALLLGPGVGWLTGAVLLVSSGFAAVRVRLIDAPVAVIAPPLAFLAAALTAGQIGMGMPGGLLIGFGTNAFLALSNNVLWIVGATLLALGIVIFRVRRDRA